MYQITYMKDNGYTEICVTEMTPYEFSISDKNKGGHMKMVVHSYKLTDADIALHAENDGWTYT